MKIYNSTDIKLGILKDLKKQIVGEKVTLEFWGKNRGIIFEREDSLAHDILYPELYYPFKERRNYSERSTVVDANYESLTPLLNYFDMEQFSTQELEEFVQDTLAKKEWLRENEELFGVMMKKYGFVKLIYDTEVSAPLPSSLYGKLQNIQGQAGFSLTKREKKRLGLR